MPAFTHTFIMDIGLQQFIYKRGKLSYTLRDHQELGAHTDIVEFRQDKVLTFVWTHPGARPMGHRITNQCPSCHRLKTMGPKVSNNGRNVILKCSGCQEDKSYDLPSGWVWATRAPVKGDERGGWIFRVDAEDIMDVA
jgi:hypothetical protein